MTPFETIRKRAAHRKGGDEVIAGLLGKAPDNADLARLADDRGLSAMAALRDAGLDIAAHPTTRRDHATIQGQMNDWHRRTGLSYQHLSRILALSIGENRSAEELSRYVGD